MEKLLIEKMNHTGSGIAKLNGKIIFIPKTVPNDEVTIKNLKEYKNYSTAVVKELITKSPNRIAAKCPYYEQCGGCQLMNLTYQEQLNYKKNQVINIFKKYGNIKINPEIIPSNQYNYRNKITLQIKNNKLGLFNYNTNDIIEIDNCLLVSPKINETIKLIKNNLDITKLSQIIIKEADNTQMVIFQGKIDRNKVIAHLKSQVQSIYINKTHIYGQKQIQATLGKYHFNISPTSFFQVNKYQTINLYNQVLAYLSPKEDSIMDLYCGTGTIGIYISSKCKQILGIEINQESITNANQNKKLNNISNINFKCGQVSKLITPSHTSDTIIVDPPRSGLDKTTKKTLIEISSNKIIYISCNPITLIRDINDLKEKYELKEIKLFDMFPNTYHVECVSLLHRKSLEK